MLFVDGNHENFDWLEEFPVDDCFGGQVQRCGENILHLMRGEIYTIEEKRFFVCGGATSTDQEFRKPHVSWWPMENVTNAEKEHALDNLDSNGSVDFILTHTCPDVAARLMFPDSLIWDGTAKLRNGCRIRHGISGIGTRTRIGDDIMCCTIGCCELFRR